MKSAATRSVSGIRNRSAELTAQPSRLRSEFPGFADADMKSAATRSVSGIRNRSAELTAKPSRLRSEFPRNTAIMEILGGSISMKQIREKKHRLPPEEYRGQRIVSFTICVKDRVAIFTHDTIVHYFEKCLLDEARNQQCDVLAYVFMPDHCHIILEGTTDGADVIKAICRFKQKTGYWLSQVQLNVRWQKDFHDHIIRDKRDIRNQINYLLANPVRKNLVKEWKEYPYIGSSVFNLGDW